MRVKITPLLTALLCVLQFTVLISRVDAVTAYPKPTKYQQPDGSVLMIQLHGDEFVHWATTLDGYTIMTNASGTYEYATLDDNNYMIFSGIKASNPKDRSILEINFLNSIRPGIFYSDKQLREIKDNCPIKTKSGEKIGGFPTTGTNNLILILANFSNTTTTYTQTQFDNYMNQANYNGTGSFRDFFIEASYGQLTVNTTVTTWVTLPNTHNYYGPEANWGQFAYDACVAANSIVNYALFDNNSNGVVDGVAIIHQGRGQEESGSTNDIWSHSWSLSSAGYSAAQRLMDGVYVDAYTTMPETSASGMGTIGVMCHEFGHNLGAPDFYDTDYSTGGQYDGTGDWDLQAGGSWNGASGTKPAHPNPYTKCYIYGWATPTILTTAQQVTVNNSTVNSNSFYRYNTPTTNEFFIIENKQQTGFDVGCPGHGMIIYHVDGNYIASHTASGDINAGSHQGLYPMSGTSTTANGIMLSSVSTINTGGCPWPGTGSKTTFSDATTPNSHSWAGANTGYPLTTIAENSGVITFCFISCPPLCTPPTTQATTFTSSSILDNSMTIGWNRGNGTSVLVVARQGSAVNSDPVFGTTYTANPAFGGGTQIGTGNYVVYSGTGTSVNVTGLNTGTTYYYAIYEYFTADHCYKTPGLTGSATTTGTPPCTYCTSNGNTTYQTSITLVNFNTINNVTAKPAGYNDYTALTTTVTKGSPYNLTVNVNTDGSYTVHSFAWIDWNQDCDFLDAGESYDLGSATNVTNGPSSLCPLSITIPTTANTGNTRMRVSTQYNTDPTSCNTNFDGEVEDYTINVTTCTVPAQPSTITGSTTPCQTSSQNYSVTNVAGVTYTWTFPTGWSQTAGGTTNSVTVTVGSGTGDITVTPSNACGNGTARTLAVTPAAVPAQPSTITGSTTPCQTSSQNYSVTNVAGVTYTWTFPTGWSQTAGGTSNSVTVTVGSGTGNVTVTPSNTCGNGTARTLAVTPSTVPAQPSTITGSTTPCQTSSQNYSVTNVAGVTYTWTFPTGWSQTAGGTTNSITVTVGSGTGNVTVTPSNTCGNGTARTLAVTPATVPAQPSTITGSTTPCQTSSQNYSVTNVAGVTYTWTFPTGWSQTAGGTTNSVTVTVGSVTGNITVTPSNTCGNGTARTLAVTPSLVPAQPSTITGLTTPCQTSSQNYSVTNVAGVTYNWTFPTGWSQTAGGTTNSITVTVGSGTGNITVTPSNACGNGTARTLAVTPAAVPAQPSTITGLTTPCQTSSQNYSVTNVAGVTYNWTFPTGWSQTAGGTTNSITVTVGSGTGNITVTPSNTCGNGTARTLAVTPAAVPAQPSTITGSTTPCQTSSQNYSVTNIAGVTYNWTFPTGWTQTAGGTTNSVNVTVGSGTGDITCTPSNTCGNGTARTLAVTPSLVPAQPSTISGSTTPCQTSSQNYSVTNIAGVTYTWTFPTGWTQTAGGTTNSITVTVGSGNGDITCTPSNTCGNGTARTLAVTTSTVPAQPGAIAGSTNPCESTSEIYSVTNVAGVTYTWTLPSGWVQTAGGTTNSITVTVGSGSGDITCTPSNTCGNGTAVTLAVVPAIVPAQPSTITGNTSPYFGTSENYSVTNVAGVTYTWTFPTGWTQTAGGTTNSVTVTIGNGSGDITCTPSNTCGNGTARTLAVTVVGVGINENTNINNLSIHPNPTDGLLSLQFKGYAGEIKITITNPQGKLITSENIIANTDNFIKTLDLSKYTNGVYYLKIVYNGNTKVEKIVKQ